jgi:hypothetical protein
MKEKQKKPRTDTELRLFCIAFKGVSKTALARTLGIPKMSFFNWFWGRRSGKDYTPTLAQKHEAALLKWAMSVGFANNQNH